MDKWKGIVTLRGEKGDTWKNKVEAMKLGEGIFLETGQRVEEDGQKPEHPYQYVSVMLGDYTNPAKAKQLYFTHKMGWKWWVYTDSATQVLGTFSTKGEAIGRLIELAGRVKVWRRRSDAIGRVNR